MSRVLLPALISLFALGATGCRVVVVDPPPPTCTAGVADGNFLSYPVRRNLAFNFPSNEIGYALTAGGDNGIADAWELVWFDTTGATTRDFSGYITAGGGFETFSIIGANTNADSDPNDTRILIYGGFGSTDRNGVGFEARTAPVGIQAAIQQSYAQSRIYYRDGNTLNTCFIDGGQASFFPVP